MLGPNVTRRDRGRARSWSYIWSSPTKVTGKYLGNVLIYSYDELRAQSLTWRALLHTSICFLCISNVLILQFITDSISFENPCRNREKHASNMLCMNMADTVLKLLRLTKLTGNLVKVLKLTSFCPYVQWHSSMHGITYFINKKTVNNIRGPHMNHDCHKTQI